MTPGEGVICNQGVVYICGVLVRRRGEVDGDS